MDETELKQWEKGLSESIEQIKKRLLDGMTDEETKNITLLVCSTCDVLSTTVKMLISTSLDVCKRVGVPEHKACLLSSAIGSIVKTLGEAIELDAEEAYRKSIETSQDMS